MDKLTIDIKKTDVCDEDMHRYLFLTSMDDMNEEDVTEGVFTFTLDDFTCKLFSEDNKIGMGSFADIYKVSQKNGDYVALKLLKNNNTTTRYHYFNEINVLKQMNHPNIIKLLGILKGTILGIVLEYHNGGNLKHILKNWKPQYCENIKNWIMGLSSALLSMHNLNFCHGDINPFNILLSEDFKVAIFCDFGSSKRNNQKPESFAGMSCYRPPELNCSSLYTTKCDIYSFGMVMWEIFTRESPFDTSKNEIEIMWNVTYANLKPNISNEKIPTHFQGIINSCLETSPTNRITSEMLYKKIIEGP